MGTVGDHQARYLGRMLSSNGKARHFSSALRPYAWVIKHKPGPCPF